MHIKYQRVIETLYTLYSDLQCDLHYETSFQLLVAVMLSAQCTDKRVNSVTPSLFSAFPTSKKMAMASLEAVESLIHSTGFYHTKAKNIIAMSQILEDKYQGALPETLEELVALPGVGRKTANVILGEWYKIPAMVVDTHVKRLSGRLGWSRFSDVLKIEQELCKKIASCYWIDLTHLFIRHGRAVCLARTPRCEKCLLSQECATFQKKIKKHPKTSI